MLKDENNKIIFKKMLNAEIDKLDIHMDRNGKDKPLIKIEIHFKGIKERLTHQVEMYDIKINELDKVLEILGSSIVHNKVFHNIEQ